MKPPPDSVRVRAQAMYATGEPLVVRQQTHARYTEPRISFIDWVLDQVPWRSDETVLDIGCGSGAYVTPLSQRLGDAGRLMGFNGVQPIEVGPCIHRWAAALERV